MCSSAFKHMSSQPRREYLIRLHVHTLFSNVEYTTPRRLSHTQAFTRRGIRAVYTCSVDSVLSHSSDLWNVLPVRIPNLEILPEFHYTLEPLMRNFYTDSLSPQIRNCHPLSHSNTILDFPSPHNRILPILSHIPFQLFLRSEFVHLLSSLRGCERVSTRVSDTESFRLNFLSF